MASDSPAREITSRRGLWLRRSGYVVGALAALILVAWVVVPPFVRGQVESRLSTLLDRPTTVEAVAFDPFRLRLTLRKLVVRTRRGNGLALFVRRAGGRRVSGLALASRAGARRAQDRSSELLVAARRRGALQHPRPHRCPDGQAHRGAARFAQQHRDRGGHRRLRRSRHRPQPRAQGARYRHSVPLVASLRGVDFRQAAREGRFQRLALCGNRIVHAVRRAARGNARPWHRSAASTVVLHLSSLQAAHRPGRRHADDATPGRFRRRKQPEEPARIAR